MTTTRTKKSRKAKPRIPKLHVREPCWDALACPFCGWVPNIQGWHGAKFLITCDAEECEVSPSVTGETVPEALARWNKRAP